MFARMLYVGLVLGISALASLGLSPLSAAEGAHPGWSAHPTQAKRPQFRPWDRVESQSPLARSRRQAIAPSTRASAASGGQRYPATTTFGGGARQAVFSANRSGGRKAVPVTRGKDLGFRFRPDERESPYGQSAMPPDGDQSDAYQSELQSQFRPAQNRRKLTYEELQAESVSPQPMVAPAMPYPTMPPPLPGYGGGYWRDW